MFTIYTQEDCPNCMELKSFMKNNNIPYEEKNVSTDYAAKANLIMHDIESTPAIGIDSQIYGGSLDYLRQKVMGA